MVTKLQEKQLEISGKAKILHEVFEEAGEDRNMDQVHCLGSDLDRNSKVEKVRQLNAELAALNIQVKELEEIEGIAATAQAQWRAENEPANPMTHPLIRVPGNRAPVKSIGTLMVESDEYKQHKTQRNWPTHVSMDLDVRNALFETATGWDPESIRISRVELSPQRPITVVDMIPMLPTTMSSIDFMEETTFTNNAVETAEATSVAASDLIGESALVLTQRSKPVEWVPVFIPVTMQQMEDVEGIEAYVNSRLTYMLRARLDLQILAGDGSTPNLEGTENVTGIQVQAKGADTEEDAIFKLFTSIRDDGFAEPSAAFLRPTKFQNIRLRKTADGQYIWGHPSQPGPFTIWGVTLVQTTAVTATKCIAGDYSAYSALYTKRGITLAVSDSHAFYFTRGTLAVRADMRLAMVHFRPKAFGEATGF